MSSISIAAEVTIDIDEKRRVWVELRAEGDNAEAIAGVLASEAARVAVDAIAGVLASEAARVAVDAYTQANRRGAGL